MRKQQRTYWWGYLLMPLTYLCTPALQAQAPDLEWDVTIGGNIWEELNTMVPLDDGSYVIGGYTSSSMDGDMTQASNGSGEYWMVNVDPQGDIIWNRNYGALGLERLWDIQVTQDGGFILGGSSESGASGDKSGELRGETDLWIVRTDAAGTILWERTIGGTKSEDLVAGIMPTTDGGFLLAAYSNSDSGFEKSEDSRGGYDFWLIKLDADGAILWDKTYGGEGDDISFCIAQAPDGFLIGGLSWSGISGEKTDVARGLTDYWLLKIDPAGNILWDKTYGGDAIETLITILPVSDGGYLLGGQSSSDISWEKTEFSFGHLDYWVLKIDEEGAVEWDKTYGGLDLDVLHAIQETPTGDFIMGGVSASSQTGNHTTTSQGGYDYWIISTNKSGTKRWEKSIGGSGDDAMTCIIPASDGGFLIGGHSNSNASGDKTADSKGMNDMWIVKTSCATTLDLGADFSVCAGSEIALDSKLTNCTDCQFEWEDGSTLPYRVASIYEETTFRLKVRHPDNCILEDSIIVTVNGGIETAHFMVEGEDCGANGTGAVYLEDLEGGVAPFKLFLDDELLEQGGVEHLSSGVYRFRVEDALGCSLDTSLALTFPGALTLDLGEDLFVKQGASIQLEPQVSHDDVRFMWEEADLSSFSPIVQPVETTTYHLIVYTSDGCMARDAITVFVIDNEDVYIPNAFSPNHDGMNDYFTVYGGAELGSIKTLKIFDKWGSALFEGNNLTPNDPKGAWDGTSRGKPLPVGVYVYYAVVQFANGAEQLFKGELTLLR